MRITICLIFTALFLYSCESDEEYPVPGGDHTYILGEKEQVKVILQVQNYYDSIGEIAAQMMYFMNASGGVGYLDTISVFSNIHPEDIIYIQGLYKVWLQNIDKGSIGPFVTFLDSTIEYVEKVDTTFVYDFRIDY